MASSWSKLSADDGAGVSVEASANEKDPLPIACRLCDQILYDSKSLLNHFKSHFYQEGTSNGRSSIGGFSRPENSSNFISQSSQNTHSLPVPANVRKSVAHENIGASAWQNASPKRPKLSLGNTFANSSQSYILPSLSRFASSQTGSGFSTSEAAKSKFSFPINPGTSGLAPGTTRYRRPTVSTMDGSICCLTRPFIKQLERPIQDTIVFLDDVGGNNNCDEMDLTLKL